MYDVFGSIRGLLKVDSVSIDNNVFRLHYKVTMFLLVACSVLVTQKQYFGDPIDCIVSDIDSGLMDTYCWIHSTFTVPDLPNQEVGKTVPHVGIANFHTHGPEDHQFESIKHHKYYQWVTLFLYFQAILFYMPRYIWKALEAGRIKTLVRQLNSPIIDEGTKNEQKSSLITYFVTNLHNHQGYVTYFFICELLNFINVVGQIYFTDRFLGYEFTTYGSEVWSHTFDDFYHRIDPMDRIFPKVAKCTFHKYGPSGTIEKHDGLCVLPLNIFNEKIFVFFWFWFIIVAAVSGAGLLYRISTLFPQARRVLLRSRARLAPEESVEAVARKCYVGDWFLLYQLAKNMDPLVYKEFIHELALKLQGRDNM